MPNQCVRLYPSVVPGITRATQVYLIRSTAHVLVKIMVRSLDWTKHNVSTGETKTVGECTWVKAVVRRV